MLGSSIKNVANQVFEAQTEWAARTLGSASDFVLKITAVVLPMPRGIGTKDKQVVRLNIALLKTTVKPFRAKARATKARNS